MVVEVVVSTVVVDIDVVRVLVVVLTVVSTDEVVEVVEVSSPPIFTHPAESNTHVIAIKTKKRVIIN
jgi:hypothetical protein